MENLKTMTTADMEDLAKELGPRELTELSIDALCELQMNLSSSIANEIKPTVSYDLWKNVVEEIVSRNS